MVHIQKNLKKEKEPTFANQPSVFLPGIRKGCVVGISVALRGYVLFSCLCY